jgi:Zn-dependent peptidase ImmA (M78 family)/transcriptional regulator with XRE-family HTH domain
MDELEKVLGERIRSLRNKLGITQKALAEQAGFSAYQTVSEIERGGRHVKAWELVKIANALNTEVPYLIADYEPSPARVLWRDYPEEGAAAVEAQFINNCRQYHKLETLLGKTPKRVLPDVQLDPETASFGDASLAAETVAKALDLGGRPAASLTAILDGDYGVKIWYKDLGRAGSAAAATGDFGYGILMHRQQAPWRRNFSFAHELFHLITRTTMSKESVGNNQALIDKVERLANKFAASLLLPGNVLENEIEARLKDGKISYGDLVELARDFDVSTEALLWRMVHFGLFTPEKVRAILNDSVFRSIDKSTMAANWQQPAPLPERFVRLAFHAYKKDKLSRARLAQLLETSLFDLSDTLREYGFEDTDAYQAETAFA